MLINIMKVHRKQCGKEMGFFIKDLADKAGLGSLPYSDDSLEKIYGLLVTTTAYDGIHVKGGQNADIPLFSGYGDKMIVGDSRVEKPIGHDYPGRFVVVGREPIMKCVEAVYDNAKGETSHHLTGTPVNDQLSKINLFIEQNPAKDGGTCSYTVYNLGLNDVVADVDFLGGAHKQKIRLPGHHNRFAKK
jgi:hypothetical protein